MNDIEQGIPVPPDGRGGTKYPYKLMAIGDSVLITGKTSQWVNGSLSYYRREYQMGFRTKTVDGGIRVWSIV